MRRQSVDNGAELDFRPLDFYQSLFQFTKTDGGRELTLSMQALKRIGQADDVADVIAFLASDKACLLRQWQVVRKDLLPGA